MGLLWDAVEAAGIRTGIYPCSWEMGSDLWPDEEDDLDDDDEEDTDLDG